MPLKGHMARGLVLRRIDVGEGRGICRVLVLSSSLSSSRRTAKGERINYRITLYYVNTIEEDVFVRYR